MISSKVIAPLLIAVWKDLLKFEIVDLLVSKAIDPNDNAARKVKRLVFAFCDNYSNLQIFTTEVADSILFAINISNCYFYTINYFIIIFTSAHIMLSRN
jgi:hypothetical protein